MRLKLKSASMTGARPSGFLTKSHSPKKQGEMQTTTRPPKRKPQCSRIPPTRGGQCG